MHYSHLCSLEKIASLQDPTTTKGIFPQWNQLVLENIHPTLKSTLAERRRACSTWSETKCEEKTAAGPLLGSMADPEQQESCLICLCVPFLLLVVSKTMWWQLEMCLCLPHTLHFTWTASTRVLIYKFFTPFFLDCQYQLRSASLNLAEIKWKICSWNHEPK